MLKNAPSFVLSPSEPRRTPKKVRLGPSLAAAALDGIFEHPAVLFWERRDLLRRSPNSAYFLALNDREIRHFVIFIQAGYAFLDGRLGNYFLDLFVQIDA